MTCGAISSDKLKYFPTLPHDLQHNMEGEKSENSSFQRWFDDNVRPFALIKDVLPELLVFTMIATSAHISVP